MDQNAHTQLKEKKRQAETLRSEENEKKGYKSIANATKIDRYCCFVNHKTTQHKKKNSETDEQDELHRMVKSRRKKCNQNDWHWIIASNFSHFLVRHFHLCAHLVAVRVFFFISPSYTCRCCHFCVFCVGFLFLIFHLPGWCYTFTWESETKSLCQRTQKYTITEEKSP